jgi:hypothetical protein
MNQREQVVRSSETSVNKISRRRLIPFFNKEMATVCVLPSIGRNTNNESVCEVMIHAF